MKKADELQIQIDDVYACRGLCAGCVLSATERKSDLPDMSEFTLTQTEDALVQYAYECKPLKRVNVTFGIADHILMGVDYLVKIYQSGSRIVAAGQPSDTDHSAVFFTTSLVGKPANVVAMLKETRRRISGDVPFLPLVVLDGRLMQATKFGPMFREMVLTAKDLFGKVDLATNLSTDAVAAMSPDELIEFAEINGFDEVTVNWAPTIENAERTLSDVQTITNWLIRFDELAVERPWIGTSFRPVIERTVNSVMCRSDGSPNLMTAAREILPETVAKSIEIDHLGFVLPKLEAIGDITHAERHGFKPLGHINDGALSDTIRKATKGFVQSVIREHAKGACAECDRTAICAGTGFHVATKVARMTGAGDPEEHGCPHVAKALIDRIAGRMEIEDAKRTAA